MSLNLSEDLTDEIELLIADEMAKMKVGGLAFPIIDTDKIVYSQGIGAKNLAKNLPADIDTIFNIASLSKSFVCAAIMKLKDEGKLDINDGANTYVPLKLDTGGLITIRHLMNHTSGIPMLSSDTLTYRYNEANLKTRKKVKLIPLSSNADFYRLINSGSEYCHKIDEYFHYNNFAYTILGHIIEEVSGMIFTDYIKKHIFDPLKMKSTSFNPCDFKENENFAVGYHNFPIEGGEGSITKPIKNFSERWEFLAAGGIFSTVRDLSTYMSMHMGLGKFKDKKIISPESAKEIQSNSIKPGTMAAKTLSYYSPNLSIGYGS